MKHAYISEIIFILGLLMHSYNLDEDYFGIVEHIHAAFFPDH